MARTPSVLALLLALAPACRWEEGLDIANMTGTIVVPRDAATKEFVVDGAIAEITSVANIGPVVLGFYPSIQPPETIQSYPHPEVGPLFDASLLIGDAYPYGGTSVGTFRSACVDNMSCRVVSGRFLDLDSMVSWYSDVVGAPLLDFNDDPIVSGEYLRQICYNLYEYTSDAELRLTVTEDRNGDDELTELDLDFVEREDGNFEAKFTVWQQEYFLNDETGTGFTAWGAMEVPPSGDGAFDTCASGLGTQTVQYNQQIDSGQYQRDLLNRPSNYLNRGDWVAGEQDDGNWGYVYQDQGDTPEIWLNFRIE